MGATGAGTGQDGGVGDGRAVVAEHAAGQGGGQANQYQVGIHGLGHGHHDGDQDAEGPPGGTGGEAQEAGHHKDDGGQQAAGDAAVGHQGLDEERGLQQVTAHAADGPGQHQDGIGGHHGLHAFAGAVHEGLEAHEPSGHEHEEGHGDGTEGGPDQGLGGAAVAEGRRQGVVGGIAAPVAAAVEQGQHGEDDQAADGHEHVHQVALGAGAHLGLFGVHVAQFALLGAQFGLAHGAEVEVAQADHDYHDDGEQGVEVVGDGGHEGGKVAFKGAGGFQVAAHGGSPAGDGRDDADGGGGGVDEVGQLGAGDLVAVRHRAHDRAHGEAVEIVVDEDEGAQAAGGEHGHAFALDALGGPVAVGTGTAGTRDGEHQRAQQGTEDDDVEIDLVHHGGEGDLHGLDDQVARAHAQAIDDGAAENTEEEGGNDFLGDQGQGDGDDGRQQREPTRVKRIHEHAPVLKVWKAQRRIRLTGMHPPPARDLPGRAGLRSWKHIMRALERQYKTAGKNGTDGPRGGPSRSPSRKNA